MWKRKTPANRELGADIRVLFPEAGLRVIFDECDRFDHDETGGRLVGTYVQHSAKLTIQVTGIIESGPQARRSAVSFFQDGTYQEGIFRQIESCHPEIEHLGNWHTHHVNGYPTLSDGDIATYHRTVNHHNHNAPFFYALLVTTKHVTADLHQRYAIKHFVFMRGDQAFYEIPPQHVEIIENPLVWPASEGSRAAVVIRPEPGGSAARPDRAYDDIVIREFYPGIRPFSSPKLGFYWRGSLELVDGTTVQVVLLEDPAGNAPRYSATLRNAPAALQGVSDELAVAEFPSARAALIATERNCNRALYRRTRNQEHNSST